MKKILFLLVFGLLCVIPAQSSEPSIWSINSREDVLRGNANGVGIDDNGSITLAVKLTELFKTDQPYVWASATDNMGNIYLGTGGDGRVYKVSPTGSGSLFFDSDEINVSAITVGKDGTVFAGTSPDGKVYRIPPGEKPSVYFEPKEKYIWSLALLPDGSLAVGTGENGKIYKVKTPLEKPGAALFYDTSETHIISMASDKNGNLFAGTDSEGYVLRFSSDGRPFALLDSPLREIHEIAVGIDGSVYVLALGESASTKEKKAEENKPDQKTVSAVKRGLPAAAPPQKSRYDLSSAKSAVYRILPDGGNDIIWKSEEITAFSVYAHLTGNGVLIGTSDKGRIYSVRNSGEVKLVLQTGEEQVSTISTFGGSLFATSSNQGKLFRFGGQPESGGTFESPVLDAKSVASWGMIWWRSKGNVQIQTRSGNTAVPNETWTDWSDSYGDQKGARVKSPKAQYLQWRAILATSATEAELSEVNVSFLSRNIPPEVLSIEILPSNIGLAPTPPVPVDPNIIALGLDPKDFGIVIPPLVPRKVFQSGAKSLQWKSEDRNGDELRYAIYYREVSQSVFRLLRENLTDSFFTIDSRTLADGRYVVKIVADDGVSNPGDAALSGERISEPFDIDNTPPAASATGAPRVNGDSVTVSFEVIETSSLITRAEYSINGGDWKAVRADDGISDSAKEQYTITVTLKGAGDFTIALRVFDSTGNTGNARTHVKK